MYTIEKTMIIDDDPLTSYLFSKINDIVHFTKEIKSFYNAVDGLDYLFGSNSHQHEFPDAIFLDIGMPIVNGWHFLERLHTSDHFDKNNTIVYMLTASNNQSDINRAKKFAHVEDYVVKPLTVERLQLVQTNLTKTSVPKSLNSPT